METILLSEFKSLVANGDWQREQHIEVVEKGPRLLEEGEAAGGRNEVVSVTGWASKTSTLGELTVSYTEHFGYDVGQPDSFYHGLGRGNCEQWVVDGMLIIDDLGNPLTERDLMPYLSGAFQQIDYSELAIDEKKAEQPQVVKSGMSL